MKTVRAIKRASISSASTWLIVRHEFIAKHITFHLCKAYDIQQWLKCASWLECISAVILNGHSCCRYQVLGTSHSNMEDHKGSDELLNNSFWNCDGTRNELQSLPANN